MISRNSNSEKYIICLNYKGYDKKLINIMCHSFKNLKLNIDLDNKFYNNLLKFIREYSNQQINNINKGIDIIKNNMINNYPSFNQITLGLKWCEDYNIKINDKCIYL